MKVQKLEDIRKDKGFLQKEIASDVGISSSFYCLVERGIRMPSLKTSRKISSVLEISLDDFYDSLSRGEGK